MYIIRKAIEYFKPKINRAYMNEALKRLSENEKKILEKFDNHYVSLRNDENKIIIKNYIIDMM